MSDSVGCLQPLIKHPCLPRWANPPPPQCCISCHVLQRQRSRTDDIWGGKAAKAKEGFLGSTLGRANQDSPSPPGSSNFGLS